MTKSSSVGRPNPVAMRKLLDAIARAVREQEAKQAKQTQQVTTSTK